MHITEFAKRCGVSVHALRHYESLGLLLPARSASGYRTYTDAMRREVVFIAMSRKVGITLAAIAEQIPAYRAGRLGIAQMVESLRDRVTEIDQQRAALAAQRVEVLSHIAWLQAQQRQARSPPPRSPRSSRKRTPP